MPQGSEARKRYLQRRNQLRKKLFAERNQDADLQLLHQRWPSAFPTKGHLVKPLTSTCVGQVAEATGWPREYVRFLLLFWKARAAYSQAVLSHAFRHDLSGAETSEPVGDQAKAQAQKRLAAKAARRALDEKPESHDAKSEEPALGDNP